MKNPLVRHPTVVAAAITGLLTAAGSIVAAKVMSEGKSPIASAIRTHLFSSSESLEDSVVRGAEIAALESENTELRTKLQQLESECKDLNPTTNRTQKFKALEAKVATVHLAKASGDISFRVRFRNTSNKPIALSYRNGSLRVTDDRARSLPLRTRVVGLPYCPYGGAYWTGCSSEKPDAVRILEPGGHAEADVTVRSVDSHRPDSVTLSLELIYTGSTEDPEAVLAPLLFSEVSTEAS